VRVINQQQSGYDSVDVVVNHADHQEGDWVLLGNFDIKPRHSSLRQSVELTGFANRYGYEGTFLEADAVKLVPTFLPAGSSDIRFIHGDHLGTPQRVTDEAGQVVWAASYLPFGEATVDEDPDGDGTTYELNLRFPGQYYDAESGLHYNHFRDYDPGTGRYIQSDPIGLAGGINTYGYAEQNPLKYFDAYGLQTWHCRRQLGQPPGRWPPPVLNHQYLCATRSDGSIECGGQSSDTPGFTPSPGRPTRPDEDWYDHRSCRQVDDAEDRCIEDCLLRAFQEPRPDYAVGPLGTDCQEWVADGLRRCFAQCR
jgi:RHS repeat-associated protein